MQKPIKTLSIRRLTWRYTALILLLALAGVMLITLAGIYTSREAMQRHEKFEMGVISRDLGDLVGFYRHIALAAAQRQEVRDILEFADVERAVLWAKELHVLVPDNIGVALIDQEGCVLGEPLQLNLGPQCLSDLEHMLEGKPVHQPPVHSDSPSLRHFDVVVPVSSGRERLGLLFMSFSLNVLQQWTEQRIDSNHYLRVEDGSGNLLAEAGTDRYALNESAELLHSLIPGSDWHLYYSGEGWPIDRMFLPALAASATILIVSLIVIFLFSTHLVRVFNGDLCRIRELLDGVYSGTGAGEKGKRETRLLETVAIMADVSALIREIERANRVLKQQSMHDSLTGLLNRRAFDESLAHYVGLAARGVTSRLVMLDLDLFKQVNDRYGHAVGDEVLKALADTLRDRCRSADVLARLGGDEFALIMPGEVSGDIDEWFDDIGQGFSQRQLALNDGKGIEPECRISAGSVVIEAGGHETAASLMMQVDRFLYEAKQRGRASIRY